MFGWREPRLQCSNPADGSYCSHFVSPTAICVVSHRDQSSGLQTVADMSDSSPHSILERYTIALRRDLRSHNMLKTGCTIHIACLLQLPRRLS